MQLPPQRQFEMMLPMPLTPYAAATDCVARARALLSHAQTAPHAVQGDLLRLSVVMAIAALDTYMHRLIVDRAYQHAKLPGKLADLEITFEQALAQADAAGIAARAAPHNNRPRVALKRQLRDRLLRETYQSFDDVSKALGMAELSGNWIAIGSNFSPTLTRKAIEKRLNTVVRRRNQIVHEGDYERLERPRTARTNGLTAAQASNDVDFLSDLIDAIHSVA